MIARAFHRWERKLASLANRTVRPFEWGFEWLADQDIPIAEPSTAFQAWGERTVVDSAPFYAVTPAVDYALDGDRLTFTSAIDLPSHSTLGERSALRSAGLLLALGA